MNTETTRLEVEVDTKIAELSNELFQLNRSIENYRDIIANEKGYYMPYQIERVEGQLVEVEKRAAEVDELLVEQEARYTGWSRFFLVPGGHIHSNTNCSSCNKMGQLTRFSWLPTLSGLTEADAVAAHGAILCTVCFPSAPVWMTNAYEEAAKAKKAAQCSGSGKYYDDKLPHRTGYYSGNWATCSVCGERQSVTKTGKVRAHKPQA